MAKTLIPTTAFDLETLPTRDIYKLLTSLVVPRPIAWVTTRSAEGVLNAAPFSFFNVISSDPVMLAIGIGTRPEGGPKDTLRNILETKEFVVQIPTEALVQEMNITSVEAPLGTNELELAGLETVASSKVGPPRIAASPAAFECRLFQAIDTGKGHYVILANILEAHIHTAAFLDLDRLYVDTANLGLIGRMHGGGWYARTTDLFDLPRPKWPIKRDE